MKFYAVLLIPLMLMGYHYEPVLLRTEAKLAPRILLMTQGVSYAAPNRFTVCIVSENGDSAAEQFRNYLMGYYPSGWKYHTMQIVMSDFESVPEQCAQSELLYILHSSEDNVRETARYASKNRKVSMSYSDTYLRLGVLVSLYIGKDIRPYLNINQAKASNFHFDDDLKRVSKFWFVKPGEQ